MTLAEAADLLVGLGATHGFAFDGSAATFVAGGDVKNLPVDDTDGGPVPAGGREVAPGHVERPAVNALMVLPKLPDPPPTPPTTANPGTGSGSKPGAGGATTTTAPAKLTTAGVGSPAIGRPAAPGVSAGPSVLPSSVGDILRNPTTKRRQTGKGDKGKKSKDGPEEEEYAGDPSIPDWNDITAALTPEAAVAGGDELGELSLGPGESGRNEAGSGFGPMLLELMAAGMIGTVLWGLQRVRDESRRAALWY
jgi:hypothetical protein